MKPNIGFIGLGTMGAGMARNIHKAGFPLYVYDIDQASVDRLVADGIKSVSSYEEMAAQCDWIILSLPNTAIVENVLWSDDGLCRHLSPGQIVIDCGTTHPLATVGYHDRFKERDIKFLDAPVSGMEKRANEGTLTTMVGGDKETYDWVKPVFDSMSSTVVYMGGPGTGQMAKVINNVFFNVSCATVAELLPFASKMGLDPEKVVEVAGTGTGSSYALNFFGPLILERKFDQGYPMKSAYKDMSSIIDMMNQHRLPIPVTMAAVATYQTALNKGFGDESKAAMVKVWEEVFDIEVKKQK